MTTSELVLIAVGVLVCFGLWVLFTWRERNCKSSEVWDERQKDAGEGW